jgi:AP-1 complex subunit gamma-1
MSIRLRELIRMVRNCKTASEERAVVVKECAAIRTALKEQHPYRAKNAAKLIYIHMLGYPTQFGQMECVNLITSNKYPEKRIGYLALMILLDENQEVLPLIEHTLKKYAQ